jgi:CO dehydrogenase nickel-insertion accessory protein CooC1
VWLSIFVSLSTHLDPKAIQVIEAADVIAIATLTDIRSLEAAINTVKLVRSLHKPIAIIINDFTKKNKLDRVKVCLTTRLEYLPLER